MPSHAVLGEVAHACKSIFLVPKGTDQLSYVAQLLGENVHFWLGARLASQNIFRIYGQSS